MLNVVNVNPPSVDLVYTNKTHRFFS